MILIWLASGQGKDTDGVFSRNCKALKLQAFAEDMDDTKNNGQ